MAADAPGGDHSVPGLSSAPFDVRVAVEADFPAILALAGEVEHLFGSMVAEPGFHQAVNVHIGRGSALVAETDSIVGGLLFDPVGPVYHIDWIVVSARTRGLGVGTALMAAAEQHFTGPGRIEVKTFGADHPGAAARNFYLRHGYSPGAMTEPGPEGGSRQWFVKELGP